MSDQQDEVVDFSQSTEQTETAPKAAPGDAYFVPNETKRKFALSKKLIIFILILLVLGGIQLFLYLKGRSPADTVKTKAPVVKKTSPPKNTNTNTQKKPKTSTKSTTKKSTNTNAANTNTATNTNTGGIDLR